jgi:hypothetical protein
VSANPPRREATFLETDEEQMPLEECCQLPIGEQRFKMQVVPS